MVEGYADALEALLADEFTYTQKNSRVEPRAELIPSIRGGRKNARMDFEEMTVRSYPSTAIDKGILRYWEASTELLSDCDAP